MGKVSSMTGFGSAILEENGFSIQMEIKCVNNRGLKINVRSRPSMGVYEKNIRDITTETLKRGSIDIYINFSRTALESTSSLKADVARAAVVSLQSFARDLGLDPNLAARDLAHIPGIFESTTEEPLTESEWPLAEKAIRQSLVQVCAMRDQEGATLTGVLLELANPIEKFAEQAAIFAPKTIERARERLQERLAEISPNGLTQTDQQSLEREICLFADRADIREELDRLASHLSQYREVITRGGEIGKRLEFLGQELLREINTTASKANDLTIISGSIEAKLAVEKIKEQSANIV